MRLINPIRDLKEVVIKTRKNQLKWEKVKVMSNEHFTTFKTILHGIVFLLENYEGITISYNNGEIMKNIEKRYCSPLFGDLLDELSDLIFFNISELVVEECYE